MVTHCEFKWRESVLVLNSCCFSWFEFVRTTCSTLTFTPFLVSFMHYPLGKIKETAVSPCLEFARKLSCLCKLARTFFCSTSCSCKKNWCMVPTKLPQRKMASTKARHVCMHVFSLTEVRAGENNTLSDKFYVTQNCHQSNDTMPTEVEEKLQDPAASVITGNFQGFHLREPSLVNHRWKAPLGLASIPWGLKLQHCV